jgi:superfamily II RNA helicase
MFYKQYELDRFQEEAIRSIEQNHSVIVAAPTGAGKTLIAEYVVEKHIEAGEQIIYTAPIKALSNQKYRDFSRDYGDKVGIVTGDVVINADAPTLIMTTEIFRNTIFDDVDRLKDVRYVIFDEIHYIDDIERGTVWEESIIFAPQHIDFVCLSATIPNLKEFAAWMRSIRSNRIDVVSETQRPVPLEYKLYMQGYGLAWLDELKEIKEALEGQSTALERRGDIPDTRGGRGRGAFQDHKVALEQAMKPVVAGIEELMGVDLIEHIQFSSQLPCLYFSLSRKSCEEKALENIDRDFLDPEEREIILDEYGRLCERYGIQDDGSAQTLRELVEHGVAYHHAGMLPTLKEVVERLFTSGCIKLLFTTETFALGINMPACTVVFNSISKYDGVQFRYLKAREYHQMAGRAGRRGIDTKGFVYACVDMEFDEYEEAKKVVSGDIERIESQFNLSYSSVLNLYNKHGERIYDICDKSLNNYQNVRILKQLDRSLEKLHKQKEELGELVCARGGNTKELWKYKRLEQELKAEKNALRSRETRFRPGQGRKKQRKMTRQIAELARMMKAIKCHRCKRLKRCIRFASKIQNFDERILELSQQKEFAKNYQRQQIKSRLALLREMGYMNDSGLLPRGEVASQIFGYELQVTELLFDEYFHRLDPDWVNVLIMSIVFESKRDVWYKRMEKGAINPIISGPSRRIKKIRKREEALGIDTPLKELDAKLSAATYEWSRGCAFDELVDYADAPPGDLVRYFRLASDLLRQMRRAVSRDDALFDKINICISKINRDVVDAERQLRAG